MPPQHDPPRPHALSWRRIRSRRAALPLVVITAHGSIAAARDAFKSGAVDFLEKAFDDEHLVAAIERAFGRRDEARGSRAPAVAALDALSARERQVLALVVEGVGNRGIGERLAISPRTVEVHKARLLARVGARNLADLIRICRDAGLDD